MDDAQRIFLRDRFAQAVVRQPGLAILRARLLEIGGEELVARDEPDLKSILSQGKHMDEPVVLTPMLDSACHENVSALWAKGALAGIATGYALSEDGLWRQHSWGVSDAGIVETTEVRECYFGATLSMPQADVFATSNLHGKARVIWSLRRIFRLLTSRRRR